MIFLEELDRKRAYIEVNLACRMEELKGKIPTPLFESMEYSLLAGGKRIRPMLLLEMAGSMEGSLPLALALEMIHTYSLIHDDLPAMDNDSMRRGKPTNHMVYGEQIAILAGDGLLNFAFETLLDGIPRSHADRYLAAMKIVAEAAGVQGMVGGQADDVQNEGNIQDIDTLESINKRKTGALIKASVMAGAIMVNKTKEQLKYLEQYSENIGLVFQIVDDLLDITGDASRTGKETGNDSKNNKITYPGFYGLGKTVKIVDELYHQSLDCLHKSGISNDFLVELTGFICNRDY